MADDTVHVFTEEERQILDDWCSSKPGTVLPLELGDRLLAACGFKPSPVAEVIEPKKAEPKKVKPKKPWILWRYYSDGIDTYACLRCDARVFFCGRHPGAIGMWCTHCGVKWERIIAEEEVHQRERFHQASTPMSTWFVVLTPQKGCDDHWFADDDADWYRPRPIKITTVPAQAQTAFKCLLAERKRSHAYGCPCPIHVSATDPTADPTV